MEQLKHECGVAMIRLLKPLEYYERKYGTWRYGIDKLYLMMEKQHNRGQEGAGVACVDLEANPGHEYMFRERMPSRRSSKRWMTPSADNSSWATCVIPPQAKADSPSCTLSCGVTIGGLATSVCAATSI